MCNEVSRSVYINGFLSKFAYLLNNSSLSFNFQNIPFIYCLPICMVNLKNIMRRIATLKMANI